MTAAQLGRLLAELQQHGDLGVVPLLLDRFDRLVGWSALHGLSAIFVAAQSGAHDCSTLIGAGIAPQQSHLDRIRVLIHILRREISLEMATSTIAEEMLWGGPAPADPRDVEVKLPPPWPVAPVELPQAEAIVQLHRTPHDFPAEVSGSGTEAEPCPEDELPAESLTPLPAEYLRPLPAECLTPLLAVLPAEREAEAPRILYLDAAPDRAKSRRELLQGAGYRMLSCDSNRLYSTDLSREAEVVLVDLPRPEETASDLIRRLWAGAGSASVPIVFLTADSRAPAYAMSMGGAEYLAMPVEPQLLLSTVAARLERGRALHRLFAQHP